MTGLMESPRQAAHHTMLAGGVKGISQNDSRRVYNFRDQEIKREIPVVKVLWFILSATWEPKLEIPDEI